MTNREIILEAANVMERQGWIDGIRRDDMNRVCVIGALELAVNPKYDCRGGSGWEPPIDPRNGPMHPVVDALVDALGLPVDNDGTKLNALAHWSNEAYGAFVVGELRRIAPSIQD